MGLISGDMEFQKWCWPHVKRKIACIEEMLIGAGGDTQAVDWADCAPLEGKGRAAGHPQPARDGLIIGNMDHHFPARYVNAMSYRGLRQAVRLAEGLGRPA